MLIKDTINSRPRLSETFTPELRNSQQGIKDLKLGTQTGLQVICLYFNVFQRLWILYHSDQHVL